MKLVDLRLERLPGIRQEFSLQPGEGVNLVFGPNGSGKSALTQAFLRLLWPVSGAPKPCEVTARFEGKAGSLRAQLANDDPVLWTRNDQTVDPPRLPPEHLARCYRLGMLDLNRLDTTDDDEALAREIRTQMAGGYDLAQLSERLFSTAPKAGHTERERLRRAKEKSFRIYSTHRQLARRENALDPQEAELLHARRAASRLALLEMIQERKSLRRAFEEATTRCNELPPGVASVQPDDDQTLKELRNRESENTKRLGDLESSLFRQREKAASLEFPATDGPPFSELRLAEMLDPLRRLTDARDQAALDLAGARGAQIPAEHLENGSSEVAPVDAETFQSLTRLHAALTSLEASREELETRSGGLEQSSPARNVWGWVLAALGAAALSVSAWLATRPVAEPSADAFPSLLSPLLIIGGATFLVTGIFALARSRSGAGSRARTRLQEQLDSNTRDTADTRRPLHEPAEAHGL